MTLLKLIFLKIYLMCLLLSSTRAQYANEIQVIKNYLTLNEDPITLTIITCWNKVVIRNLIKDIASDDKLRMLTVLRMSHKPIPKSEPSHQAMFMTDLSCLGIEKLLREATNLRLFASPHRWIMLTNHTLNEAEMQYYFGKEEIFTDSNVVLIQRNSNGSFNLIQPYKYTSGSLVIIEPFGSWTVENGFKDERLSPVIAVRRQNLMGTVVATSIVLLHNNSFHHLDDFKEIHVDTVSKANYMYIQALLHSLNATGTYSIVSTWGYPLADNVTWTGMTGELQRGVAEIAGTPLFLTKQRFGIVRYIAMLTPTKLRFVFRQPPLSLTANVFALPFTRAVWISEGVLILIMSVLLYFAASWEKYKQPTEKGEVVGRNLGNRVSDIAMMTIGAICQQGSSSELRTTAGRTLMILLFLILMFLYTSFSANIVALLQSSSSSIRTLSDLLNSRLALGSEDTAYSRYYLRIYETKLVPSGQEPHFMTLEEGVKKMQKGLYAFHMELGSGYKLVGHLFYENEKCGLQEIDMLHASDPWLAVAKNSSYAEIFKIGLSKILERGIKSRIHSRLYTSKPKCLGTGGSFVSVGLIDIYFAFIIIATGTGVAAVVFCIEIFYNRYLIRQIQIRPRNFEFVN